MEIISFLDPLLDINFLEPVFNYIYNFESTEIWIIIITLCVSALFLAYKWFGIPAVAGLAIVLALAYILYISDIGSSLKQRGEEKEEYNTILMEEIEKK